MRSAPDPTTPVCAGNRKGRLCAKSNVTYRGIQVGVVDNLRVDGDSVVATMFLDGAVDIPKTDIVFSPVSRGCSRRAGRSRRGPCTARRWVRDYPGFACRAGCGTADHGWIVLWDRAVCGYLLRGRFGIGWCAPFAGREEARGARRRRVDAEVEVEVGHSWFGSGHHALIASGARTRLAGGMPWH
ncbi:MlaD family protein [Rhodococcus sp. ACPA1]|uniref:MlaD family protein n=1 Tax=Rhodococcus sp. ACPA1 TaxID=2028572 RepID=UPI00359CA29E